MSCPSCHSTIQIINSDRKKSYIRRRKPNEIIAALHKHFDQVISLVEGFSGFSITPALAEEMLFHYIAGDAHEYYMINFANLSWTFAYRTGSHSLFGQRITDPTLRKWCRDNVPNVFFDAENRLNRNPEGKFYQILFCYMLYECSDQGCDHMQLCVSTGSGMDRVKSKRITNIIVDHDVQRRLFTARQKDSKHNQTLLAVADRVINRMFVKNWKETL